ncbi:DUF2470 domain-containing protein [Streptomyces clavuligerus]|nr:DUF2470 domain-containing protein [Streptomyces clavuligerus]ANW21731.1 DUF2470 domain-containing protein [Streptomyces clavuligerus]AXU16362.1 DUF2470 domain-containing protein [Streptomyces clavuligerus]MBY6301070.1 DUF2470 domain-containing protein [Streptomyces clavuligerus]QCS09145.1 DUF2470 domain-containing protein [Streptomyces clavuligerus]QPJ96481.1 DUF2470 domain-containing protein [Streptomyces clavuligerus]
MRRLFNAPPAEPTGAERVRSILTAADSMTVVTDEGCTEVSRLDSTGGPERIHLHPPSGRGADTEPEPGAAPPVRATVEFTDVAPAPVRDRVRARVVLTGWLLDSPAHAATEGSRCMELSHAVLEREGRRTTVGLEELMDAETDPLAVCEAGMLTHMSDEHGDIVELLLRLVKPRAEQGIRRVLPLAIDRYGITLRLEYDTSHSDARLPFPARVDDPDQAGERIHALLNTARHRFGRNRLLSDS